MRPDSSVTTPCRPFEPRIHWRMLGVVWMRVPAGRVRLPHLDHRASDRRAVLVDDGESYMNQLAERLSIALPGNVRTQRRKSP